MMKSKASYDTLRRLAAAASEPETEARQPALEAASEAAAVVVNELDAAYEAIPEAERAAWLAKARRALADEGAAERRTAFPSVERLAWRPARPRTARIGGRGKRTVYDAGAEAGGVRASERAAATAEFLGREGAGETASASGVAGLAEADAVAVMGGGGVTPPSETSPLACGRALGVLGCRGDAGIKGGEAGGSGQADAALGAYPLRNTRKTRC